MIYNFLFPSKPVSNATSFLILTVRIIFGILFLLHGWQKLSMFDTLVTVFPDPLGVGSRISLMLAIFAELFCSVGFILGFLYRLALIPMIFTMSIAFFIIHGSDPLSTKELALVYLVIFVIMFIAGPGKYAIDPIFLTRSRKY